MIGGGDVKFSVSADEPQWVLYRFGYYPQSLSLSLSFPVFRPFSDNMFLLEMIVERNRLTVRVLASFVY